MRPIVFGGYAILCSLLAACGGGGGKSRQPDTQPPTQEPLPAGTLQFSAASLQVSESQASVAVSITRTAGSRGATSVTVSTANGTAVAGQDYTAVNTTVTFADGDTTAKTVTIPVLDDSEYEPNETFTVTLTGPTGDAKLGTPTAVAVTVASDDPEPTPPPAGILQFSAANLQVSESQASVAVSITRTAGSRGATSVTVSTANGTAVAGQDYTAVNTMVTFADGDTAVKTVTIPVIDDSAYEPDETFTVTLTDPTGDANLGTQATVSVTLQSDDPSPPTAAQLDLNLSTKQLLFSWPAVSGVTHYRLLADADGVSGFTQVGANIVASATSATLDIAVHRHDWANARYKLAACNITACTDSNVVDTIGSALQAIGYFKASNAETNDFFGSSVALSADGNTLAIAAQREASAATGVDGDETDNTASLAGAVYVFTRTSGGWSQQAYVKASNAEAGDGFGTSLAFSEDGNTLAVGASQEASAATGINGNQADNSASLAGAVYVFTRANNSWSQQAYVKASNTFASQLFGDTVALSGDGDTLAVGAFAESSAATGINGNQADNSAPSAGAVYVFTRTANTWSQQAYVKASNTGAGDQFGTTLALDAAGETLAVGASLEDSAATGINSDETDNTVSAAGAVYVFTRASNIWSQLAYVKASNTGGTDQFGVRVALSSDGNTLAVGASQESSAATGIDGDEADNSAIGAGAVYVFTRASNTWSQQAYVKASNTGASDQFGSALALSANGDTLAVGAYQEDGAGTGIDGDETSNGASNAGAVYTLTRSGGVWSQQRYVKASNSEAGDTFGLSLALSADGDTLAVGANNEDGDATGINGDQSSNTAAAAGAVYLY